MAPIWPAAVAAENTTSVASTAMLARARSGQRARAIPHTAWATTATATTLSPWRAPSPAGPVMAPAPKAKSVSAMAEGKVNPAQAARPPARPPRDNPTANPTWLDAGPGRNWQSATRSA